MNSPLRVLHLEDDVRDAELVHATLEGEGVRTELTRVETEQDFASTLNGGSCDLILADYTLPSFDGLSALRIAQQRSPDVPFIFVSGTLGEDVAIEALKTGATDYVLKTRLSRLGPAVTRALREAQERTQRKRAEAALRRSEEELRNVIETIPAMVWSAMPDGSNVSMNKRWLDYTGLSATGLGWQAAVHPDDLERHLDAFRESSAKGVPFQDEVRFRRIDGEYRWFVVAALPLRDEESRILKWYGIVTDIEDRKRAEKELERSEAYLAEAERLSHVGSWGYDPATKTTRYWSKELFRIFEKDPERGIPPFEETRRLVHPDDLARASEVMLQGFSEKAEFEVDHRILLDDGTVKHLHEIWHPVLDKNGELLQYVGTAADVTQRVEVNEALRASEQLSRSHVEVMLRSLDVLTSEAAPEKFIGEMLRTMGQHLHANRLLLWLRNSEDDLLRLHVVIEDDQQVPPDPDHPGVRNPQAWKKSAFVEEMFFTKSPLVIDDIEHDSRIDPEFRQYLTVRGCKKFLTIPMCVSGEVRGFIAIWHAEQGAYHENEIELAQALAHHVILATHEQELVKQQREAAILKERTRMARDIHDTLAQGFTGVIMQMEAAEGALLEEDPEHAVRHVRSAREIARESLGEARRSVHALRPQALEEAGFADALKAIIQNTTAGTSLHTDFCLEGEPRHLPAAVEESLLRIGQEALSNALKHAQPTQFQARLCFDRDAVRLELWDDGKGFVLDGVKARGIGLVGMKERAEQIGATLEVKSEPGAGTRIVAVSRYQHQLDA